MLWLRTQNLEVDTWRVEILRTFKNDFESPVSALPLPLLVLPEDGPLKKSQKFNYQPKFFIFDDSVDKEVFLLVLIQDCSSTTYGSHF